MTTGSNYTAILEVGQTPNQLGIFFRGDLETLLLGDMRDGHGGTHVW